MVRLYGGRSQPRQSIERVAKSVDELRGRLETLVLPEYHPTLDLSEAETRRRAAIAAVDHLDAHLREAVEKLPATSDAFDAEDAVRGFLEEIFEGKIGAPYAADVLARLCRDGDQRFSKKVPPGYKDIDKASDSKYGDFLIWTSLLSQLEARTDLTGLIFVTNDRKEDWWLRKESAVVGARPELIRECVDRTGRLMTLYTPAEFLRLAKQHLKSVVSVTTMEVAERVSNQSPVAHTLRGLRMCVPNVRLRIDLLRHLFAKLDSGQVSIAGDLGPTIESFNAEASHNHVVNPLFYALISDAYGPLGVEGDGERLREKRVYIKEPDGGLSKFVQSAHVAWLAQAMYRLRKSEFSKDEIADAFFGLDAGAEAMQLIDEAARAAEEDAVLRGH